MSNAIQQIADQMLYKWENAVAKPVKLIRILINKEDASMLDAFYDYMLALDTDQADLVFLLELPFEDEKTFSKEILTQIETEINYWNTAEIPDDIPVTKITWKVDYSLEDSKNPVHLVVANLHQLVTYFITEGLAGKVSFVFKITSTINKELVTWFAKALENPQFHEKMIFGVGDYIGFDYYNQLCTEFYKESTTITPDINLQEAMNNLASQSVMEEGEASSSYRAFLVKLMESVRKRNPEETLANTKKCLDIAVKQVAKDPNWLSQVVAVYTILYTDKIGYKKYDEALFFADKAIESANLATAVVDASVSYRLLGQTLMGKGSILSIRKQWYDAYECYLASSEAYTNCNDYLMQCEALRLTGWSLKKAGDAKTATAHYVTAYHLVNKLSEEQVKNSSYPMVVKELLNNVYRIDEVTDDEMDATLQPILGDDWITYVKQFGKFKKAS